MSNTTSNKKIVITKSAQGTKFLGRKAAQRIIKRGPADRAFVLALQGDLGSGKTTFVQGLAEGLAIRERVISPTFIIMRKSEIRNPKSETNSKFQNSNFQNRFRYFYHFDCYRIDKPEEILELGWSEIVANPQNIVAIEWPERIKKFLPEQTVSLNFKFVNKAQRIIKMGLDLAEKVFLL